MGRRIFSRIFSPDFFPSFLWEKCPEKILQENPRQNPPKIYTTKIPDTFLQRVRPKVCASDSYVILVQKHASPPQEVLWEVYIYHKSYDIRLQLVSLNCVSCTLSGPVLRDTARLSQRYPPIARYGVFGVLTWPVGCDTPSAFSERFPLGGHAKWRCDTPPQKGYLSDTRAIPYENKANGCDTPSAILSRKGIARYGGVSRTGPLRLHHLQFVWHTFVHVSGSGVTGTHLTKVKLLITHYFGQKVSCSFL